MKNIKVYILFIIFISLFFIIPNAKAQTVYLDTATPAGPYSVGANFNVPIRLNTGGQSIIAVNAVINFDTTRLAVTDAYPSDAAKYLDETGSSFANSIYENRVEGNRIQAYGININGISGTNLLLATINFRALAAGAANVNFSGIALTNDTCYMINASNNNILTTTTGATYTIGIQTTATLALNPPSGSYAVNSNFSVNIVLNTGTQATDGTEIDFLKFDQTLLQVTSIQPGILYLTTDRNTYSNSTGEIRFSQTSAGGTTFTGSGNLATINFRAVAAGTAAYSFSFTAGLEGDCDVSKAGGAHEDILNSVTNGSFTVTADTTPPANVTNFTATAGNTQVILAWTNPTADFTGTKVCWSTAAAPTNAATCTALTGCAAATCTHSGLTNGTRYYYTAFSYDSVPNYASGVSANALPVAPLPVNIPLALSLRLEGKTNYSGNVTVYFLTPGTNTERHHTAMTVNAAGNSSLNISTNNVPIGTYDLRIVVPYHLTKKLSNVSWPATGATVDFGAILAGDLAGTAVPPSQTDNVINSVDWSRMASVWGTNDAIADITQSGEVTTLDWHYLNKNWGTPGQ